MSWASKSLGACAVWMLALAGCAVQPIPGPSEPPAEFGWIAIDGATIPAETVTVPNCGASLLDCLSGTSLSTRFRERRNNDAYREQSHRAAPTAPSHHAADPMAELRLLWTAAATPLVADENKLAVITDKVLARIEREPNLTIPDSWQAGWPHYLLERDGRFPESSRTLIESWASADCRESVELALDDVQRGDAEDRGTAIARLQELLQNQCFAVPLEHQARAWCFAGIGYEQARNGQLVQIQQLLASDEARLQINQFMNNPSGAFDAMQRRLSGQIGAENEAVRERLNEARILDLAWRNFFDELKTWQIAAGVAGDAVAAAKVAADVIDPEDELCLWIRTAAGENLLLPMAMIYDSAVGGLWVFPGDRLTVFQFRELPFARAEAGAKRLAILGLVPEEALLQTQSNFVFDVVHQDLNERFVEANLLHITSEWNGLIVHTYLPTDPSLLPKASQQSIEALLKRWSVHDGSALTFEASALSPLLMQSKLHQRAAVRAAVEMRESPAGRRVAQRIRMGHEVQR